MTPDEMNDHMELQSTTIDEQKATIGAQKETLDALTKTVEELKKTAVTPEDLVKLKEAGSKVEELAKKNEELQGSIDESVLKVKFPAIKDWTLIKGTTLAEKEEHATKLCESFGVKLPDPAKPPVAQSADDKGNAFKGVGGPGAPPAEMISEEEKNKKLEGLRTAQKSGDLSTVLDACIDLQPKRAQAVGLSEPTQ